MFVGVHKVITGFCRRYGVEMKSKEMSPSTLQGLLAAAVVEAVMPKPERVPRRRRLGKGADTKAAAAK